MNDHTLTLTQVTHLDRPNTPQLRGVDALLDSAWRHRLLIFAVAVVFAILGGVAAHYSTPVYRGKTVLAPSDLDKKGGGGGMGSVLGSMSGIEALADLGLGGNDYATEEALAVLKSQALTEAFIQERNLLPLLFPKAWDPVAKRWKPGKKPPTLGAGFRVFDKIRKAQKDKKTELITLQIDWRKDPVMAADLTNGLVERLNDEMRQRALKLADASLGYLQSEYAATADVDTREAISRLMQDQIRQQMLAHVTKEYALKVVDPAMASDLDFPAKPIPLLYIGIGLVFGAMAGTWLSLRLDRRRTARR
jgi:uncharacterized protein involved in exopolysaccharide biosynthesis